MVFIYVLKLKNNKYYVGKTNYPEKRLEEHVKGSCSWTKKYKPIGIEKIIPNCDDYDEDKYTRIYMDKYGVENVRGGSYCNIILEEEIVRTLNKMKLSTQNRCFKCKKMGHFAKECSFKKEFLKNEKIDETSSAESSAESSDGESSSDQSSGDQSSSDQSSDDQSSSDQSSGDQSSSDQSSDGESSDDQSSEGDIRKYY